jgi:Ca2+-binding RTX toxin-like protein
MLEDRTLMAANVVISAGASLPQFKLLSPDTINPNVNTFGANIVVLSNGNVVVSDPTDSTIAANAGAVFLFDGHTGALLSEVTGSTSGDMIGSGGVTTLTNGNFVISSPNWQLGGVAVGAATWVSGSGGTMEAVSAANSLTGSTVNDQVTSNQLAGSTGVTALANGNYVVDSPFWQDSGNVVGAVTWGNGFVGSHGTISSANSLVGSASGDEVGSQGVTALTNGNYVVSSPNWQISNSFVGAATWGNGLGGTVGPVSASNSLVGQVNEGGIATGGVTALANGNYVVVSPGWQDAGSSVGAVTWGNGSGGTVGDVSTANSLTGATSGDSVGQGGVVALTNGNYVVSSPFWQTGGATVGAVTWAQGDGSAAGVVVSAGNSLVGSTDGDLVGGAGGGVTALSNGNYVVASPNWQTGGAHVGAVTWGDGNIGTIDFVSANNSLIGSTDGDAVGFGNGNPGSGVTALSNGNYVVISPSWQTGGAPVGAVTWAKADGSTIGPVNATNSLVGSTAGDQVGSNGVTALPNGNYVVDSPFWQVNGAAVGAVTWGKADGTTVGPVSGSNLLEGSINGDNVGSGGIVVLSNGNYIVNSPNWQLGATQVGAATWVNGSTGQTMDGVHTIDLTNSFQGPGSGAILQQVIGLPGGNAFLASLSGNGGSVVEEQTAATTETFAIAPTQTITLSPSFLTASLNAGISVVLQASNDITVNAPIVVTSGHGGNLTLDAGRTVLLFGSITTGNGNLTLIANDNVADGVVDSQRGSGVAAVTMSAGTALNTGTGNLTVTLGTGAGNTNFASDDITLGDITAKNVTISNDGPGDASIGGTGVGSGVDTASVTASGNLIIQSTGDITQAGALAQGDPDVINVAGTTRLTAVDIVVLNNHQNVFTGTVTYTIPGGDVTIDAAGNLTLASTAAANTLTVNAGGILTTNAFFRVSGASSFTAGTIRLNAVQTNLQGPVTLSSTGTIDVVNSSALTLGDLTLAGAAHLTAPNITFAGALNVGTQTLTLTNSAGHLNGSTTIAGGTIADSLGLTVGGGATLSGFGTLQVGAGANGVTTQIGATLAPDVNAGVLTINGDLTLAPVSIFSEQIKGTSQFSQMTVSGNVNLNNATLQIAFDNPYIPASGDQFQMLTDGPGPGINGTFAQGSTATVGLTTVGIAYSSNVLLTVGATPAPPAITVPGAQSFVANKSLALTGISVAESVQFGQGMVVQATLSVQNGTISLANTYGLSFSQGTGTNDTTVTFTGLLAYVNLALSTVTYRPAQDSALADSLSININDLGHANPGVPMSSTKAISLTPTSGNFVVPDPVLPGKQDLVVQGLAGNDTVTVAPKGTGAYVVTVNGAPQTLTGINGRILVLDPTGNNNIAIASTVTIPAVIAVGDGNNTVVGGAGSDTIRVGSGSNTIDGGAGVNTLVESGNVDFTLVGGTATTPGSLTKGGAQDTLVLNHIQKVQLTLTGPGSHTIDGTAFAGTESFRGGTGNDTLKAGNGPATLTAGSGNDLLMGGSGNDALIGGAGNDVIQAGSGSNTIDGGGGVNTLIESGNVDFTLVGGTAVKNGSLTKGKAKDTLVLNHIQQVQLTLTGPNNHFIDATAFSGPETLTAAAGNDTLKAGSGAAVLIGGTGNDVLVGGAGNDVLTGGTGNDSIQAGAGSNTIDGGAGTNTLIESGSVDFTLVGGTASQNGSLTKGAAQDTLVLNHIQAVQLTITGSTGHVIDGRNFSGTETFKGGSGSDILLAGSGNSTLNAGSGNDVLVGGAGNDKLVAGAGRSILIADVGAALMMGGANQDLLIGGSTIYDGTIAALSAIMAEWSSANSYATRIGHLSGTLAGGANGNTLLTVGAGGTVQNNSRATTITGGGGLDWFLSSSLDKITDLNAGGAETKTLIP